MTDYLSKENTTCLKGVLAICVFAHHLYQYSGIFRNGWQAYIGICFQALGYLSVAIFFFLSGYGLMKSYRKKPEAYPMFARYKILPFYVIDVLLVVVYGCLSMFLGRDVPISLIVCSLTFGGTVVTAGWYIQVQLLYYWMFYLVFSGCKDKQWLYRMLFLHCVYVIVCGALGLSSLYYERTFIFVLGMIWAEKQAIIDKWAQKGGYVIWGASCILFLGSYFLSTVTAPVFFRGLSYFFLIPVTTFALCKINIQNAVTRFLGSISLEIYVLQGVYLNLFRSSAVIFEKHWLYIAAVITATILSAFWVHPFFQLIYNTCRKGKFCLSPTDGVP